MPIAYIAILFHWHIGTSLLFYLVQHLQCRLDADQTEAAIKATMKMLNIIENEYENNNG